MNYFKTKIESADEMLGCVQTYLRALATVQQYF